MIWQVGAVAVVATSTHGTNHVSWISTYRKNQAFDRGHGSPVEPPLIIEGTHQTDGVFVVDTSKI